MAHPVLDVSQHRDRVCGGQPDVLGHGRILVGVRLWTPIESTVRMLRPQETSGSLERGQESAGVRPDDWATDLRSRIRNNLAWFSYSSDRIVTVLLSSKATQVRLLLSVVNVSLAMSHQ